MKKITEKTTLSDILQRKGAEDILAKYNLPCLSCPMAAQEISELQIGKVAEMYGLDIKNIIKELNSLQ